MLHFLQLPGPRSNATEIGTLTSPGHAYSGSQPMLQHQNPCLRLASTLCLISFCVCRSCSSQSWAGLGFMAEGTVIQRIGKLVARPNDFHCSRGLYFEARKSLRFGTGACNLVQLSQTHGFTVSLFAPCGILQKLPHSLHEPSATKSNHCPENCSTSTQQSIPSPSPVFKC